jgi:hypothetical protein
MDTWEAHTPTELQVLGFNPYTQANREIELDLIAPWIYIVENNFTTQSMEPFKKARGVRHQGT